MKLEVLANNIEQTEMLARVVARKLKGGELIELVGDVGAGKTSFTKALVEGLESDDLVTSPTFAISNVYQSGRLPVYHFDFYRLSDDDEMIKHELSEIVQDESGIIILEWAESIKNVIDKPQIVVNIEKISDEARKFVFTIPKEYEYIGSST